MIFRSLCIALAVFAAPFSARCDDSVSQEDFDFLVSSAKGGDLVSHHAVGLAYLYGRPVPQNFIKAIQHIRIAAAGGLQSAQHTMALCFENKWGVPYSHQLYLAILRKNSEEGYQPSQTLLGLSLANDLGIEPPAEKEIEAYKWLIISSSHDSKNVDVREKVRARMPLPRQNISQSLAASFSPRTPSPLVFTNNWALLRTWKSSAAPSVRSK